MAESEYRDEDALLRDLAQLAKDQADESERRWDAKWDRWSEGELSEAEASELTASVFGEDVELAKEGFRPFDEAFHSQLVQQVAPIARAHTDDDTHSKSEPRKLGTWAWPLTIAAMLLLSLGIFQLLPRETESLDYVLSWEGGIHELRSGEATESAPTAPSLAPGIRLTLTLTPSHSATHDIGVRGFVQQSEVWHPWPEAEKLAQISPLGAVRIDVIMGRDLHLAPGPAYLWLAIGPPGHLPSIEDARSEATRTGRSRPGPSSPWQLLQQRVEIPALPQPRTLPRTQSRNFL